MNQNLPLGTIRRVFAIVVLALLGSSLSQRYLGHPLANPNLDFHDYYFAAQAVREHSKVPLYIGATEGNPQLRSAPPESILFQEARQANVDDLELYLYPPLLADVLVPLTHLSVHLAASVWRFLNLALVFGSVLLLAKLLRIKLLSSEFALLAILSYSFWPIHEAISLGQVSIVMLALWAVGIIAYSTGKPHVSAIAFAFATAFKVTPLLLLPLFLIWRDRQWILYYLSSLAALILLMGFVNGGENLVTYAHVMRSMSNNVPALQNKCIGSLVAWLHYREVFTTASVHAVLDSPNGAFIVVSKVASLGFYVACLALVWRRRAVLLHAERVHALALFALVTAVSSPVSWRHGYVIAIVPLGILWVGVLRAGATRLRTALLALTTVTMGSLVFDLAAQLPLPFLLKIFFASTWTLFSILLCLQVLWSGTHTYESSGGTWASAESSIL